MFNEATMPVQLRDYRNQLLARDEFHAELHGDLLETAIGEAYHRLRTMRDPDAPIVGNEKFDLAYLQVRRANSLWRVWRWEEAAAAISLAIEAFEGKSPLPKGD
jgi:hypothetical protein